MGKEKERQLSITRNVVEKLTEIYLARKMILTIVALDRVI
jgi:hypothetical protein